MYKQSRSIRNLYISISSERNILDSHSLRVEIPKLGETSQIRKAELQADIAVRDDSDNRETLEF